MQGHSATLPQHMSYQMSTSSLGSILDSSTHILFSKMNSFNKTSNIEHQRLEQQNILLYRLMGNKVFHSPLDRSRIHKMLDIGCGTGAVTHEMASMFPDAQVIGADLSPVPEVRQKLSNISYVQGNIMELEDARFERNSFDLVFSRLLVLGMPNWKAYVERCVALAKPGVS